MTPLTTCAWLKEIAEQLQHGSGKLLPTPLPDSPAEAWDLTARIAGVSPEELTAAVAAHFNLPVAVLQAQQADPVTLLSYHQATQLKVLPLRQDGNTLCVATSNPLDLSVLDQLRFATGGQIALEIQSPQWVEQEIMRSYGAAAAREAEHAIVLAATDAQDSKLDPVVRLSQHLLRQALERGASDIHLQPYLGGYLVRLRVDGVLTRLATLSQNVGAHVIRHFKAVGGADVTNALVPDDGHATLFMNGRRIDLRLSTLPNVHGERLVVRLLDQGKVFSLVRLGYAPVSLQSLRRLTRLGGGLILFVGPTGCGKTTALYAMLSSLNNMSLSIATLEEPVEYEIAGLSQVSINPKQGISFAIAMRAQLRQDPDVLLIGEIRDEETAEAAARAALTGHLVFSTLHSASARYAVPRLLDLGISAPLLGETLRAAVAQRLVRKLCVVCSHPATAPYTPAESLFTDLTREIPAMRAAGCESCHFTGYRGVVPVVEIYRPSPQERAQLLGGRPPAELWQDDEARSETSDPDNVSMALRLRDMVISGITSAEEAPRALGSDFWHAMAQHYQHMGWLKGELTDMALAARSDEQVEVLVASEQASLVPELDQALSGSGYHVLAVDTKQDLRSFMALHPNIGVLLADLEGNESRARSTLRNLQQQFAWSGIPALVLIPEQDIVLADSLELRLGNRLMRKPVTTAQIAAVILSMGLHG